MGNFIFCIYWYQWEVQINVPIPYVYPWRVKSPVCYFLRFEILFFYQKIWLLGLSLYIYLSCFNVIDLQPVILGFHKMVLLYFIIFLYQSVNLLPFPYFSSIPWLSSQKSVNEKNNNNKNTKEQTFYKQFLFLFFCHLFT